MSLKEYKIRKIYVRDLRPKLLKRLQFLTNGGWARQASRMYDIVTYAEQEDQPPHIWAIYAGKLLVGWCVLSVDIECSNEDEMKFTKSGKLVEGTIWALDVYVAKSYRRKGFGKALRDRALQYTRRYNLNISVTPWNYVSICFYKPIRTKVVWDTRCL